VLIFYSTLAAQVFSSTGDHDGRFHIKRTICFAATDKQEPVVSRSSDMPVLHEAESGTKVTPASENSYFAGRGAGKPGFISFQESTFRKSTVESVPHPGKEASRLVWFIGPTILVSFLVLPSLYLRKVLSAVFEDSLLTGILSLIVSGLWCLFSRLWMFHNDYRVDLVPETPTCFIIMEKHMENVIYILQHAFLNSFSINCRLPVVNLDVTPSDTVCCHNDLSCHLSHNPFFTIFVFSKNQQYPHPLSRRCVLDGFYFSCLQIFLYYSLPRLYFMEELQFLSS
jgi:hypothetical protein